jgi:hypothetical protein
VFQNLLRAPDLELPDQAEVLPSPSSSIVHLALQIAQLGLLCLAHHRHQFTGTAAEELICQTRKEKLFSVSLLCFVREVSAGGDVTGGLLLLRKPISTVEWVFSFSFANPLENEKSQVEDNFSPPPVEDNSS